MTQAPANPARPERPAYRLKVNSYDRASSLLIAMLVMVGVAVLGLVIVFFAQRLNVVQTAIPVTALDPGERSPDAAMGLQQDIEPPGVEEPELEEPALPDTLNAISSAISARTAILSDDALDSDSRSGMGSGLGDARQAGTGSGNPIREPRRELRFEPYSLEEYARFLDFFSIELAVWGRDNQIYYASNLSSPTPTTRVGKPTEERRFRMASQGPPLEALDRRLARQAGISQRGPIVVQYYPQKTEGLLLGLEKQRAGDRPVESLAFTAFRVNRDGGSFSFAVEEQQ